MQESQHIIITNNLTKIIFSNQPFFGLRNGKTIKKCQKNFKVLGSFPLYTF